MGEVLQQVEQSVALLGLVGSKREVCFLCKWIEHDLRTHKKLTGWPLDSFNKPEFPVEAKLRHVALEFGEMVDCDDVETLAKLVLYLITSDNLRN